MGEKPDGLMGPMAILGILDKERRIGGILVKLYAVMTV
jgi:hypothetical protein